MIRNGLEIEKETVTIAMEYHYEDNTSSHNFYMATFLAPYLPSMGDDCYQSYESKEISSNSAKTEDDSNSPWNAFDLNVNVPWEEETYNFYVQVAWDKCIPQINGFMINVGYSRTLHPSSFTLRGYPPNSSSSDLMVTKTDYEYENSYQNFFALPVNEKIYQKVRMQITKTGGSSLRLNELALLTCRYSVPEKLELTETELNLNAYVDTVRVLPVYDGFVSCSSTPTLPSGLSINYQTCIISGTPREVKEETTYTIKSLKPQETTTTLKITVTECTKTILEVERTYGAINYMYETHWLRKSGGDTVERVYQNTVQQASKTVTNRYCFEGGLYELTVDNAVNNYWRPDSYIKLNLVYGTDTVTILNWKYDLTSGYNPSITVNINAEIPREQEWHYIMGEVPEGWDSATMPEDWSKAKKGSFGESTNQLQIYKYQFSTDITTAAGYEMELMYTHGIIVVINGIEVFRNNVEGAPTNETYATDSYSATKYRRVSLPLYIPATSTSEGYSVIKSGNNVVAICLVARTAAQRTSTFDASLHIMGRETVGRVFDYTASTSDSSAVANNAFDLSGQTVYTSTSCNEGRYIQITFNDDRREWISKYVIVNSFEEDKISPNSWVFQAKNEKDSEWTTLNQVNATAYWYESQGKEIWINNLKPYNSYRIFNLLGDSTDTPCEVNLSQIGLFADSMQRQESELAFSGNPVGYLNVDFENLIPTCVYYKEYRTNPSLPSFLSIDEVSGYIRGSNLVKMDPTVFTITASKLDGSSISTELTLSVIECDKSMVQLVILTDSYPSEMGWELYQGSSASGDPISSKTSHTGKNSYQYKYFCLDNGIYTFKFIDSYGDGWAVPAGYRVMSNNYLTYAQGTIPRGTKPVTKIVTFSNNMVIKRKSSDWRVLKGQATNTWASVNFDHSSWTQTEGGSVGKMDTNTIYLRHLFSIDDIIKTPVLNVQIRYSGGAAAYINGVRVYRVHLPNVIAFDTAATDSHSSYAYSQFSIPLQLKGGKNGQNVLAVELHRTSSQGADTDSAFEVEAILAYGDCAVSRSRVDSYKATTPVKGSAYGVFDTTIWNYISWDWIEGTYVSWEFENLDGVFFNKYRIYSDGSYGSVSWVLQAKREDDEVYTTFDSQKAATLVDRDAVEFSVPNGIIGYKDFRLEIVGVEYPTGFTIDELEFAYCAASGNLCPGVGDYPSVAEGEISVSTCPQYYDGYSYRECKNQQLGEVKLDRCSKFAPSKLEFAEPIYTVYVNAEVTGITPTVFGLVDDYQILPELPEGLSFNTKTGSVVGKPEKITTKLQEYTVTGYNENGSASGSFKLSVITGYCDPDEFWPRTEIGTTYVYDCKEKGNYVGTMRRSCKLGKTEPEWGLEVGFCMAVSSFIAMGVLLLIVILIVIVAVVKVVSDKKKANARSGVRGGKKARNIMKSVPYAKI